MPGMSAIGTAPFGSSTVAAPAAATEPFLAIEMSLATAPGDTPVWVDYSADERSFSITRGKQNELDEYQAGTCTVVLDNRARQYDPTVVADVLPMRRLRLRATFEGVTYPLFDGYIDSWDLEYQIPNDATVVVSATDGFKVFAAAGLASSAYTAEVEADAPAHWWRLGEPVGSPAALDSVGTADLDYVGPPTLGSAGLVAREAGSAVQFTSGAGQYALGVFIDSWPWTTAGTIEVVWRPDNVVFGLGEIIQMIANPASAPDIAGGSLAYSTSTGQFVWQVANNTATAFTAFSNVVAFAAGTTHHVAATFEAGQPIKIYVDGVDVTMGSAGIFAGSMADTAWLAAINGLVYGPYGSPGVVGTAQMAAIYTSALSPERIAAHAAALTTPWRGDTAAARIGRVLDEIAWPAGKRELDTGLSTLQSATLADTALDQMQKVEQSEFGDLFMTADGNVRFVGRTGIVNLPEQAVFGDGAGELGYSSLTFDYSDQLIRNDVTISRNEGVAQEYKDATSITAYLLHSYTRDGLIHDNDEFSLDAAEMLVNEYKDPLLRVTGLTFKPDGDPTNLFPQAFGRELAEEITVKRRPPGGGAAIAQDVAIEGINLTHDSSATPQWSATWRLSPAFTGSFIQWDVAGPWDTGRWYY